VVSWGGWVTLDWGGGVLNSGTLYAGKDGLAGLPAGSARKKKKKGKWAGCGAQKKNEKRGKEGRAAKALGAGTDTTGCRRECLGSSRPRHVDGSPTYLA